MLLNHILTYGGALAILMTIIILGSLAYNPRLWLQDASQKIKDALPPKTEQEKKQTLAIGVVYLLVMLAVPLLAVIQASPGVVERLTFWQAVLVAFGVFMIANLVDLVVIDWLIVCTWMPGFLFIPGTEHLRSEYREYGRHFRAFLKGSVLLFVLSLPIAGLGMFL